MTEIVAYTLAGIILYLGSDWILVQIEKASGRKFEYRSLVFFVLILVLALSSFTVIRALTN